MHYGCGTTVGRSWLNYDSSPSLRLSRVPLLGATIARVLGLVSFASEVRVGNIVKGLPVADESVNCVFASHVLEHLSLEEFQQAIANTFRMMAPGATLRIVVPDLEARAAQYLASVRSGASNASSAFMDSTMLGQRRRPKGLLAFARQWLGGAQHLWMWDEITLKAALTEAGFAQIRRCKIGDADDTAFVEVEMPGRFYDERLGIVELAIEAKKPSGVHRSD